MSPSLLIVTKLFNQRIVWCFRLKENPFSHGQLGGHCQYNPSPMRDAQTHRMSLSSW